jgi:hypothetical protein
VSKQRQVAGDPSAFLQTLEAVDDAVPHRLGGEDAGELVGEKLDQPGELGRYWPRRHHLRLMSAQSDA